MTGAGRDRVGGRSGTAAGALVPVAPRRLAPDAALLRVPVDVTLVRTAPRAVDAAALAALDPGSASAPRGSGDRRTPRAS